MYFHSEVKILHARGKSRWNSWEFSLSKCWRAWPVGWKYTLELYQHASVFLFLTAFLSQIWWLDAELTWTKNKYILKQGVHFPMSESLLTRRTAYCFLCWFSRLVFNVCQLWNLDFTLLIWKRPKLWSNDLVCKDGMSFSELVFLLTCSNNLLQVLKKQPPYSLETLKKNCSGCHAYENQSQTIAININCDFFSVFPF